MNFGNSLRLSRVFDIHITLILNGERHFVKTYQGEYRSLMALLYDKFYIEDFGDCKGVGRCGTCHIHILDYSGELLNKEGNESTTLNKMAFVNLNSRLACQIMIDHKLHGLHIKVVSEE